MHFLYFEWFCSGMGNMKGSENESANIREDKSLDGLMRHHIENKEITRGKKEILERNVLQKYVYMQTMWS